VADRLTESETPPVLLYDGGCGFCTSAARVAARISRRVQVLPWQRADLDRLGVRAEDAAAALQWVGGNGRVDSGAAAAARLLVSAGGLWALLGRVLLLPGIATVAEIVYRLISANRHRLPGGTPACRAD
jgi:predicted DCC family thiol-disulfide oxidoreductase YuxK